MIPKPVDWRCPTCAAVNTAYVDPDPVPYYCDACDHAVTLKELLRALIRHAA